MRSPPPPSPLTYKPSLATGLSTSKQKNTSGYRINQAQGLVTLHDAVFMFQFHHNLLPKAVLTTSFHLYHLSIGTVLG